MTCLAVRAASSARTKMTQDSFIVNPSSVLIDDDFTIKIYAVLDPPLTFFKMHKKKCTTHFSVRRVTEIMDLTGPVRRDVN